MKKIMLGLVAAIALVSFAAPAFAGDDAPAADAKPAKKKGKKAKKAAADAAPAMDDAAKK